MDETRTPDHVLADIRTTRAELLRGSSAIYDAETKAEALDLETQAAEDSAFLTAEGSVEARKAVARAAAMESEYAARIARAEFNRVKVKIRALESALVSLQSELRWLRDEGA